MKKFTKLSGKSRKYAKIALLFFISFIVTGLNAQNTPSVGGRIIEEKSNQPVPFATVCLINISGDESHINNGTISDENGAFSISPVKPGNYKLQVSSIGYKSTLKSISVSSSGNTDAGIILLQDSTLLLEEAMVVGKRPAGKSEDDRTVYFVNKEILAASGNAPGLLRHIPGIQVDLRQNIYLEGSPDILIYVNGIERDKSYVSQLNPSLIEKIEILNTPPSNYEGDVTGIINIVLKKEKNMGVSGQVFTEIPTSKSIVYSFPSAGLNYGFNKMNVHLSYNGEINYEDIDETTYREIRDGASKTEITSIQQVRQKNLSHNFQYGFDYYLSSRDMINFYGSYNPYSWEQDGNIIGKATGTDNQRWNMLKDETDRNINNFHSLYYKHKFNEQGREISIDISKSNLTSSNSIVYLNDQDTSFTAYENTEKPGQSSTSVKIDFVSPLGKKLTMSTGAKIRFRSMHDRTSAGFSYNEQLYALYGMVSYKVRKNDFNIGMRLENAESELINEVTRSELSFLPYATLRSKINSRQNLRFSYRRSINRPSVYLLNPYTYQDDPYSTRKGNPLLKPEFRNILLIEHSIKFEGNYLSSRLFYRNVKDAMNKLTFLNDTSAFETRMGNPGTIHQYGLQLSGSLKFGPLTLNPNIRLYNESVRANDPASVYGIGNQSNLVFESSFSSILSLKHDFALSAIFQYATPKINIQEKTFSDPLYFISLDKSFKNNLKLGIMTALPFSKSFIYQGSEIEAADFTSYYTGNLKLPLVPVMFKISYQFNAGKERTIIKRDKEEMDKRQKSGL